MNPSPTTISPRSPLLDHALLNLQSAGSQFATLCIHDSRARLQYGRDVAAAAAEISNDVEAGKLSAQAGAERANALRNQIMDLTRRRSSPVARAYAARLKREGLSLSAASERYAQRLYGMPLGRLGPDRQARVFSEIVRAAGRPDARVMQLAGQLGRAGRRMLFVSLAVAVYEVSEAEDKPREAVRQTSLAGAGIVGGWAVGGGAVALGVCAATAPVCVGAAAFVGGILAAYATDFGFDTLYPSPKR